MGFLSAVESGFRRAFDFSGRASRAAFLWWLLFLVVVSVASYGVDRVVFPSSDLGPVGLLTAILLVVPTVAIIVRRLHDFGRSGWWCLLLFAAMAAVSLALPASIGGIGVADLVLALLGLVSGEGTNRWGPGTEVPESEGTGHLVGAPASDSPSAVEAPPEAKVHAPFADFSLSGRTLVVVGGVLVVLAIARLLGALGS